MEVVEFETQEEIAYVSESGWIIDPDNPWH